MQCLADLKQIERPMSDNQKVLAASPPNNLTVNRFFTAPFIFSTVALAMSAVLSGPIASWLEIQQAKKSLPLRQPLGSLNTEAIHPYRVVSRQVLEPGIVEALGTDQYISWTLEDTSLPANHPLRMAYFFVTYYTGGHHLVPHTPDVCYLGSGYEPAQPHENEDLAVLSETGPSSVPVRVCTFAKTAVFNRLEFTVVYTFFANGEYAGTRNRVRVLLNDLRNRHAFFSKIEASFPGAGRRESIEGARKLFSVVLPVLAQHHWPDFRAAEETGRVQPS
jgi:hypothetical protein